MELFVFRKVLFLVLGYCLVCNSVQSVQAQPLVLDTTRLHSISTESPTPLHLFTLVMTSIVQDFSEF